MTDNMAPNVLDTEFKACGFTGEARKYPLSQKAFEWLCKFNGIQPEQAPRLEVCA